MGVQRFNSKFNGNLLRIAFVRTKNDSLNHFRVIEEIDINANQFVPSTKTEKNNDQTVPSSSEQVEEQAMTSIIEELSKLESDLSIEPGEMLEKLASLEKRMVDCTKSDSERAQIAKNRIEQLQTKILGIKSGQSSNVHDHFFQDEMEQAEMEQNQVDTEGEEGEDVNH